MRVDSPQCRCKLAAWSMKGVIFVARISMMTCGHCCNLLKKSTYRMCACVHSMDAFEPLNRVETYIAPWEPFCSLIAGMSSSTVHLSSSVWSCDTLAEGMDAAGMVSRDVKRELTAVDDEMEVVFSC